jgi:hypothetical protein
MNCLRSLGRRDRVFESRLGRGCLLCVHLFCVCVVLCVGRGLATGRSPAQSYRLSKDQETEVKRGFHGCPMLQME